MLDRVKKGSLEIKEFYDEMLEGFVNKQMDAIEIMNEYCESYFFFQLSECRSNLRLKLSDNAAHIYQVLSETRTSEIKALKQMSPRPRPGKRYMIIRVCNFANILHP